METSNIQNENKIERQYLRQAILEMRELGCNKVADLLCGELAELEN